MVKLVKVKVVKLKIAFCLGDNTPPTLATTLAHLTKPSYLCTVIQNESRRAAEGQSRAPADAPNALRDISK